MGMGNCPRPVRAIMILLLLSATVLVALAQQPTPCQTPPQWQGKFSRRDEKKNFTMFADINKEYKIDLRHRNCTVGTLTRPFIHFGIPPDAKYVGTANIGPVNIPDEHATVILFEGTDRENGGVFYGEVTAPDCVPVSSGFYSNRT